LLDQTIHFWRFSVVFKRYLKLFVIFHSEELTRYGCVHVVVDVVIRGLPAVRSRKVFYRGNRKCGKTSQLGSVECRVANVSVSVSVSECAAASDCL